MTTIGIIGSGKVGSALGAWAAAYKFKVMFAARHYTSAHEAACNAGYMAQAADISTLVDNSDLLLLTLPFSEVENALAPVRDQLRSPKILVDVTTPLTEDHQHLKMGYTDSGAESIARLFPNIPVVKAFNATFAEIYAAKKALINGCRLTVFYAGDDTIAKEPVKHLIETLGFDAVDAGPLQNARLLEPLSLLNIHLGRVLGMGTSIGFSLARTGR